MREREEEPIATACDFGVIYSLYSRPQSRASAAPRLILKISWEDKKGEVQSSTFELNLERETLTALGRKGNSLPPERFDPKWFCEWARRSLKASAPR
jgi:hypothetical protein